MNKLQQHRLFNGNQQIWQHDAHSFQIYLPPMCEQGYRVPTIYCLANREFDFAQTGIQRYAAQWGIALVFINHSELLADLLKTLPEILPLNEQISLLSHGQHSDFALRFAAENPVSAWTAFNPEISDEAVKLYTENAQRTAMLIDQSVPTELGNLPAKVNLRKSYDNSIHFLSTFADVHIEFHADGFGL
ncbi:MAG: hypothetical protein Q4E16_03995 [Neisseria sp.]|nr:hypothetical protein [Neisseria sp.]